MSERTISVIRHDGGVCIVALSGEHDLASADELTPALKQASHAPAVIVDLSATAFVDSAVLRVLISSHRETVAAGGRWGMVVGPGSGAAVRRIMELTGLDLVMPVYGALGDALAAIESGMAR